MLRKVTRSELEQGIALLQGWADAAGDKMASAARHLDGRQAAAGGRRPASRDRRAGEDLGRRDPVPPPARSRPGGPDEDRPSPSRRPLPPIRNQRRTSPPAKKIRIETKTKPASKGPSAGTGHPALGTESEDLAPLTEIAGANAPPDAIAQAQGRGRAGTTGKGAAARRGAEGARPSRRKRRVRGRRRRQAKTGRSQADQGGLSEGDRAGAASRRADGTGGQVAQTEGSLRLPIRRPRRRVRFSKKFRRPSPSKISRIRKSRIRTRRTRTSRSRIRRINRRTTSRKKSSRKTITRRKTSRRKSRRRSRQKKQEEPKKSDEQKQEQKQPQPQVSRDQIEEALRKVRERQQEKRERDRRMKARVFGRVPVEKDW